MNLNDNDSIRDHAKSRDGHVGDAIRNIVETWLCCRLCSYLQPLSSPPLHSLQTRHLSSSPNNKKSSIRSLTPTIMLSTFAVLLATAAAAQSTPVQVSARQPFENLPRKIAGRSKSSHK
jgi:hypothetical protein